jgi:hypothetical protein
MSDSSKHNPARLVRRFSTARANFMLEPRQFHVVLSRKLMALVDLAPTEPKPKAFANCSVH